MVFYCKIEVWFLCFFILIYWINVKCKWNLMIIMFLLLNYWFIYGDVVVFCGEFLKYIIYVCRSDVLICNVYFNIYF